MPPDGNIVEPQVVPPLVEHSLIKTKDSLVACALGKRHESRSSLKTRTRSRSSTRDSRCQSVSASTFRADLSTTAKSDDRCSAVMSSKSKRCRAARNVGEALSKYGVPGPTPGRVAQAAPAGINDSRPFNLNPTHPRYVRTNPAPESSTCSV